jgi:DNA modification methylase
MSDLRLLCGDSLEVLPTLGAESVQCVVTSPPYWGLRDYGVEGQLGLEPTPEEYVGKMVEVFREVRRVLRGDGVLWLNLGDSYNNNASNQQGRGGSDTSGVRGGDGQIGRNNKQVDSLKPKDLVGIPWRVARALQEPYYTGTIRNELDRVWLAAMIEAEGCMFIHKRKEGQSNGQGYERKSDSFGAGLEVANTHEAIVRRVMEIVGRGSICSQGPETNTRRKQTIYRWNLRSNECREVIREVYPYLVGKQQQARLVLGCPSSGPQANAAHAALIGLHNGIPSEMDFPAPVSMFEPGFYLRSDVIWSKCNPMPESVTDRPTKSHEYVFMLTKAARYFWDAGAVAEVALCPGDHGFLRGPIEDCDSEFVAWRAKSQQARKLAGVDSRSAGCATRNLRTVWTIATEPYPEAHFATFPTALAERCIRAGSRPGDVVLDPFAGSGTVGQVGRALGRSVVLIELNPEYVKLIEKRCALPWERAESEDSEQPSLFGGDE